MTISAVKLINIVNSKLGIHKHSSGHKEMIDTYNRVHPLPVGYLVTYDDDWCDVFVSYIGIILKATKLIGRECGVQRHVAIFKQLGIWKGKVSPQVGDIVVFDWQGNGWADHIGFVVEVSGDYIKTTEGNTNNRVGQNTFVWNDWRITGYARPRYGGNTGPQPVTPEVVSQVLAGTFGNGQDRMNRLIELGYQPENVQKAVNERLVKVNTPPGNVAKTDYYLAYNGDTLSVDMINELLVFADQYQFNPLFLIVMLHFEGLWGGSDVAQLNNNLAGITWSPTYKGHPDVAKTKGSPRPELETGNYVKYHSVSDFLKDWTYLLRPGHFYHVAGNKSFNESIKGLFKVGGARYDYAASGYDHYLSGMNARKNAIEKQNPGKFDVIQNAYNGGETIKGEEIPDQTTAMPSEQKTLTEVSQEVMLGLWGDGEDRVSRLNAAGYNYDAVQNQVNELLNPQENKSVDKIAKEVVAGKYGNGKERTEKLRQAGYDAETVQKRVNELLKQDLTEVAKDVIRGQYGNGQARIRNLRAVGYNPEQVQAKVNELM